VNHCLGKRKPASAEKKQDHAPMGQARLATLRLKDRRASSTGNFVAICPREDNGAALALPNGKSL
jgi:hypothetical protein